MNIVFMGTPDFSLPSLKILLESKHKILAVVTQPDKERGRGQKVSLTPVKQFAVEHNLPVYQPEKSKGQWRIRKANEIVKPGFICCCCFQNFTERSI